VKPAHHWFWIYTLAAILATATKLLLPQLEIKLDDAAAVLSWLAILLPVMAVAVMTISASLDKEARASTYQEMLGFLDDSKAAD
jgi:isocitrate dehydrogenase kinase/phosphatase